MTEFNSPHPDQMEKITLKTVPSKEYELLDSGDEEKLERFGAFTLSRPDPQALWPKRLGEEEWAHAEGRFERRGQEGIWHSNNLPKQWEIEFGGFRFAIKPTSFKHTGIFPEQEPNWKWIESQKPKIVLNLFAYTGGATLAAARAGASVTHVDASKTAVTWAKENAALSKLEHAPIRWIVEDVITFVEREIKRGNRYDMIIMDPPAFGHGPKDELWKFEEHFLQLIKLCEQLLSEAPVGILINGYAAGYSSHAFAYNLERFSKKFGGNVVHGDLSIQEKGSERLLPCGIFARWQR
jgi:23S rRNA (cytosine1962-C5)-methyltransferase